MYTGFPVGYQPMYGNYPLKIQKCCPGEQHDGYQVCQQVLQGYATPMQQFSQQPMQVPAKFINSYAIDYNRKVGNGNFSNVFIGIDQRQPNVKLAVKVVDVFNLRQKNLEYLVKSQVQILLAMRHQNIIFCRDVLWDETYCYIFTQFCDGGTLQFRLKQKLGLVSKQIHSNHLIGQENNYLCGPQIIHSAHCIRNQNILKYPNLSQQQILPLIKDIFNGMLYLQRNHIIHRDIKSANIFLKENRAVIADFGFARYVNEPFKDLNIGSLPYMSPQVLSGNLYSSKTDVWAFGVVLYEIFHGENPFARSHDVKQLMERVYVPMSVTQLRGDLSVEMKELILTCLEIDMDKRRNFSEIERMWFCTKLFDGVWHYNYGYCVDRSRNMNRQGDGIYGQTMDNRQCVPGQLNYRNGINGRCFGSRFKDKVNIGNCSKSMNYSNCSSSNNDKNMENEVVMQEYGLRKAPIGNFVKNSQPSSPRVMKNNALKVNFHVVSPMSHQENTIENNISHSSDQNHQNHSIHNSPKQHQVQPHILQHSLQIVATPQKNNVNHVIIHEPQKIPFRNILLRIQEIRTYYKLAMLLKDRNKTMTEIKNRLFIKSVKQMKKIQKLIEKDLIDLSVYDKTKKIKQFIEPDKKDEKNLSIVNRKLKLSQIIKDYKIQFETQLKRRDLNISNIKNDTNLKSSGYLWNKQWELEGKNKNLGQLEKNDKKISPITSKTVIKGEELVNFSNKTPSLSQDIEYVIQSQMLYHPQYDEMNGNSFEQYRRYRTKVKETLEQIMHMEKGASNQLKTIQATSGTNLINLSPSKGVQGINFNNIHTQGLDMMTLNSLQKKMPKQQYNIGQGIKAKMLGQLSHTNNVTQIN